MKPKTIKINTEKLISESGPLMPIEVAKEIWLQLHKTRNSTATIPSYALEKNEEHLYQYITHRLMTEAAIVGVKITQSA